MKEENQEKLVDSEDSEDEDLLGIDMNHIIENILDQLSKKEYFPKDYFEPYDTSLRSNKT